jgi:hypothetical protein
MAVVIRRSDQSRPHYPEEFVLNSPASGNRSVGIVRLRTKSHGDCFRQLCEIQLFRKMGNRSLKMWLKFSITDVLKDSKFMRKVL